MRDTAQRHRHRREARRADEGHLHARRGSAEKPQRIQTVCEQQATVDDHDVQRARQIQGENEVGQRQQPLEAIAADQGSDQPERADRRELQDEARDLEHHVAGFADEPAHSRSAIAQLDQGETEQRREEDHLQNAAFRQRCEGIGRHHVEQHLHRSGHHLHHVVAGGAQFTQANTGLQEHRRP
jgi:hypothetical protein